MTTAASLREIQLVAVNWVAEIEDGLSPQLQAELYSWLDSDKRHRIAFLRARHAWGKARELSKYILIERLYATDPSQDARDTSRPEAPIERQILNYCAPVIKNARRVLTRRQWFTTARLMPFLPLLLLTLSRQYTSGTAERITYGTNTGEHRSATLADGSMIELNTHSRVRVESASTNRTVRLDRGEAYFHVVHNAKRNFLVIAGDVVVRDVGTAFAVRAWHDGHIDVVVSEGTVEVEFPALANPSPGLVGRRTITKVSAGESATIRAGHVSVTHLSSREVDCKLGWRDGTLCLEGETIAEAVEEFNRYNQRRLIIDNPTVAQVRIVGFFSARDPESFAAAINGNYWLGVTLHKVAPGPYLHLEPPRDDGQ